MEAPILTLFLSSLISSIIQVTECGTSSFVNNKTFSLISSEIEKVVLTFVMVLSSKYLISSVK